MSQTNVIMKRTLFLAVCFAFLLGCGASKSTNRPPVFKVKGKVTYKGQPVVGADVTFTSESANRSAFGRTDDSGEYQLTTFSGNDGAVEGKQSVMITKTIASTQTVPEASTDSPDYIPPGYGPEPPAEKQKYAIPAKYGNKETSGLIAVVNPDPDNVVDFELKD
jgi:hypothetical protein